MKPEPMSDEQIDDLQFCQQDTLKGFQWLAFARTIIEARDKKWADLIDTWTVECVTADTKKPEAALVEVRRTNGPWQRYNVYYSVSLAEATKARTNGNGLEVRVVPLYRGQA